MRDRFTTSFRHTDFTVLPEYRFPLFPATAPPYTLVTRACRLTFRLPFLRLPAWIFCYGLTVTATAVLQILLPAAVSLHAFCLYLPFCIHVRALHLVCFHSLLLYPAYA